MKPKRLAKIPAKYQKSVESELFKLSGSIRAVREVRKLSQEELAEGLGIGTTTIQAIERGRRYPSLPTLFYVCQYLGIEIQLKLPKQLRITSIPERLPISKSGDMRI